VTSRRVSLAQTVLLLGLLSLVPLALLAYFSTRLATDAVRTEVETQVRRTADMGAEIVERELSSVRGIVEAYAGRPTVAATVAARDERRLLEHLDDLRMAGAAADTAIVTSADGRVMAVVPSTPGLVGTSVASLDWHQGAAASGQPYLSTAFTARSRRGRPIVAVAAPVRNARGETTAYLAVGYDLRHLRGLAARMSHADGAAVQITDSKGALLADGGRPVRSLVSRREEAGVRGALEGGRGLTEIVGPSGPQLVAFAPVEELGWAVTASVPADKADAAVARLRETVALIGVPLGIIIVAGLAVLIGTLAARRRAEDEAREQASITRSVLDATPIALALVDRDGNRVLTNEAFERLTREIGLTSWSSFAERVKQASTLVADGDRFCEIIAGCVAEPARSGFDEIETLEGRVFELYSAPVLGDGGEPIGRVLAIAERTAERQAEQLKDELVATVSHELRTPLASIVGFAELLAHRDPPREVRRHYLETIHVEAKRLTDLVNDFLDVQTLEGGRMRLSYVAFDLVTLVREEMQFLAAQARDHTLAFDAVIEPLVVNGDRDRIVQVIENLLSNAVKYAPGGGTIRVRVEPDNGTARVTVTDEGIGIPAEQQDRIFEKFFRVDTSDTRSIGGTGLGLALCKQIVEAHGGRIGFTSEPGRGSSFWFEVPVALPVGERPVDQPLEYVEQP
jgi:signal transduction histidine kinase